ncbi:MAG: universal stress protein [bacterium]|nr:universal stress protein [bacterium]
MNRPRKLLVATDFSGPGKAAESAAITIASQFGAELHWLHALEVPLPIFEPYAVAVPEATIGAARSSAKEKLGEAAARAKKAGLEGTTFLGEVPAAYAIADRAKEIGADLVIVGTHGHTGVKRVVLGSVAEHTVKLAPCSVLTVKDGALAEPAKCIVVGVDFSEGASEALDTAVDLAKEFGAALHLVHALDLRIPFVTPYEVSVPDNVIERAHGEAVAKLEEMAQKITGLDQVKHEVRSAPPSFALIDAAADLQADLVVTGSRGLSGLKHLVLGSVAERTLRGAPCSVWTVRPTAS